MKILVVTQYYLPEPGATSNRLEAFVDAMVKRGHEVTVICEFPNHPTGVLSGKDRWRIFRVEKKGNYRIIRTFVFAFRNKNNIKRMLFYLSFAFSSFIASMVIRRHDIVFSSSPPIFHVLSALFVSRLKGSRFVLDIRDIWPDTALYIEAVRSKRLLKWGRVIERKLYRDAELIFTISDGLSATISARGGTDKVYISYNGSNADMLEWKGDKDALRAKLGWTDKFIVVYAGLIGLGQNLIKLSEHIREITDNKIQFIFIGDGPEKEALKNRSEEMNLSNVTFLDLMTREEAIAYTHAADVSLVILREADFFKSAIPSKFFDCMAAGKPVISNVDGELREFMEKYDTGIYFSYREEYSFKDAIMRLFEDPALREAMGLNGRKLVAEKFLRNIIADETVEFMENN
ncbi:MAG: glycosyltransferase family 4 protein [candidate division Zixibacteria bacterium]